MQQLLSVKQVSLRVCLSVSQIRRLVKSGQFPKPMKISPGRNGWLETDIEDWVANLVKEISDV